MQDTLKVNPTYAWSMGFPQQPKCENARDCAGLVIEEMVASGDHVAEDHLHDGWWA